MNILLRSTPYHCTLLFDKARILVKSESADEITEITQILNNKKDQLEKSSSQTRGLLQEIRKFPKSQFIFGLRVSYEDDSMAGIWNEAFEKIVSGIEEDQINNKWSHLLEQTIIKIPDLQDKKDFLDRVLNKIEDLVENPYIHKGSIWFQYSNLSLLNRDWRDAEYAITQNIDVDKENNPSTWSLESAYRMKLLFKPLLEPRGGKNKKERENAIERWLEPHFASKIDAVNMLFSIFNHYAASGRGQFDSNELQLSINYLAKDKELGKILNEIITEAKNIAERSSYSSGALVLAFAGYYSVYEVILKKFFSISVNSTNDLLDELASVSWYSDKSQLALAIAVFVVANHYRNGIHLENYDSETEKLETDYFNKDLYNFIRYFIDYTILEFAKIETKTDPRYHMNRVNKRIGSLLS